MQFRVLHCPGLLTRRHSFLFLFPFPLFIFFLPHFSSFLLSSLSIFLSSLSLFLSLFVSSPPLLLRTSHLYMHAFACILTHGFPCVTHMACNVSYMHLHACLHMACHVSPNTRCLEKCEIPTISEFNEIRLSN